MYTECIFYLIISLSIPPSNMIRIDNCVFIIIHMSMLNAVVDWSCEWWNDQWQIGMFGRLTLRSKWMVNITLLSHSYEKQDSNGTENSFICRLIILLNVSTRIDFHVVLFNRTNFAQPEAISTIHLALEIFNNEFISIFHHKNIISYWRGNFNSALLCSDTAS